VIAVSPIVHGHAVKGPLAGMLESLGHVPACAASVAAHYGSMLRAFVVERGDEGGLALPVLATETIMRTRAHSRALAERILEFARELGVWA
jgi:2-phospho-L-lactate transferase/gluconeogenesis factor (CofD/UPF0052 family)